MPSTDNSASAPITSPAVLRCIEARRQAYQDATAKNLKESEADRAADDAFERAMPHLAGAQNIRDFIACVAYAMVKRIIFMPTATKLLYAAQVALAGVEREPAGRRASRRFVGDGARPPAAKPPASEQPHSAVSPDAEAA